MLFESPPLVFPEKLPRSVPAPRTSLPLAVSFSSSLEFFSFFLRPLFSQLPLSLLPFPRVLPHLPFFFSTYCFFFDSRKPSFCNPYCIFPNFYPLPKDPCLNLAHLHLPFFLPRVLCGSWPLPRLFLIACCADSLSTPCDTPSKVDPRPSPRRAPLSLICLPEPEPFRLSSYT